MTYNSILISKDGKLLAMNKPEKPDRLRCSIKNNYYCNFTNPVAIERNFCKCDKIYNAALQSSISAAEDEGIEFKDEVFLISPELHKVRELGIEKFIGQHYSVPSGWEIRVWFELNDGGAWKEISEEHYNISFDPYRRKVALLVRVEEKKENLVDQILNNVPLETKVKVATEMAFINLITELGYRENKAWDEGNEEDMRVLKKLTSLAKEQTKHLLELLTSTTNKG